MKNLAVFVFLLVSTIGSAQNKLLITDFVFFNNFDSPANANITNFFQDNPDRFEFLQDTILTALDEEHSIAEVSFYEKAVDFVPSANPANPSKSYEANHKRLIKEGEYDYYLLVFSNISEKSSGYSFKLEIKLANKKGKKVVNNSMIIEFSMFYNRDEIANSELFTEEDFFGFYNMSLPSLLKEQRVAIPTPVLERIPNPSFADFIAKSKKYTIQNYKSERPVLKIPNQEGVAIRIKSGKDTDIDISEAKKGLLLIGEKAAEPIIIGIRNPKLTKNWIAYVNEKANESFDGLEIAPSADIIIRVGDDDSETFRLINGRLVGKFDSKSYLMTYDPSANLLRIMIDKELVAVSQPLRSGSGPHLKMYYSGPAENLNELVNLHQVYFQAITTLEEARN